MNQLQAQSHMRDLIETFRVAYPMAFSVRDEPESELVNGIASTLRDAISEGNTTAAAMIAIWFASRAPKSVLLAFIAFIEDDQDSATDEWPEEINDR
jgi:hypothetical protein